MERVSQQKALAEVAKLFLKRGFTRLSFIVTWKFKQLNTAFIIFGGALLGYLLWLV